MKCCCNPGICVLRGTNPLGRERRCGSWAADSRTEDFCFQVQVWGLKHICFLGEKKESILTTWMINRRQAGLLMKWKATWEAASSSRCCSITAQSDQRRQSVAGFKIGCWIYTVCFSWNRKPNVQREAAQKWKLHFMNALKIPVGLVGSPASYRCI